MWALYKKELNTFFSSLIGYITIGLFLLMLGLMMWVFPDFSILNYPVATMQPLFTVAPFVFMFLLPALTMSSLAEEHQTGTFELLATKPLSDLQIVMSKYLASITLVLVALLPTLLYYYTVYQLGSPPGNLDAGQVTGSYIGLVLLSSVFAAIGLFGSSLSRNQIVGFITSFFLCFVMYWGFSFLSRFPLFLGGVDAFFEQLGIEYHYNSISRGLFDSRDLIYFLSLIVLFNVGTVFMLTSRNWK